MNEKNKDTTQLLISPMSLRYDDSDDNEKNFLNKDGTINKTIIDQLDSEIIILDKDLNIVLMNKIAEENWGVLFEDVKGTKYASLRLKAFEKNLAVQLKDVVTLKKTFNIKEKRVLFPDNVAHFLDLSCMPIVDKDGQIQGVMSVSKDVTKKVSRDLEYKEAKQVLQQLTHELDSKSAEIKSLKRVIEKRYSFHNLIGSNNAMRKMYDLIEQIAPTDATILITGETGSGKELVARAVHYNSNRKDYNLVAVNCAALPETLLESELFGHVKGSFTGAIRDKKGKFELADKGTLFLDEIGELPLTVQVKLLRFLQEREIERVGDEKKIKVDVRVIAATHRDLNKLIKEEKFRKDLFYRLNVINVKIPSLSERKDDILNLSGYFIELFNRQLRKNISGLSKKSIEKMMRYSWPGNVRELEAVIERAMILEQSDIIQDVDLPDIYEEQKILPDFSSESTSLSSYKDMVKILESSEREYFLSVFEKFKGKITDIARFTQLDRRSILNKMKKFDIDKSDFK